ncbi:MULTISPECIES: NAD(P)-dependent oxidoreductase [unclassified Brevundimonas]|jgi:3-hydroxyisobutyrate dehydrogenase|uniref:NAD(P)-dependent oxidoreductase n=1 Tax=unclassified Brevundimonas TaxID=2622653 RepID=UPI000C67CECC|nr:MULTISPECIES: NAD(P)-dependent oxidoreductase [unclassified Brevundimonas]MAL89866.1 oxidoreductase [Brevundimonas sp.]|tara:strand:+ start:11479 stop:12345 length:867 start_codon:yes stop_codon:yes gene_type:complete
MKIAFSGLGVMGAPMAGHLIAAGHMVTGHNRSAAKAEAWAQKTGGTAAATAAEAARGVDLFILCVGNDDDVREVVGAALPELAPGAVIVDHTTTSAKVAREMAERVAERGVAFLDAPVSGGQAGAEAGKLSIMIGGDADALARVEPVLAVYAKAIKHMGPAGSGQLTKMANQIAIAGVVQGLAEAVHFAQSAGLDTDAVYEAISQGAAQSWQMDNRWKTAAAGQFDFGFAVDWMRKDLGLVLEEARANGSHLAVTALVDQFYSEVQAMGGTRWDTSSLAARLQARKRT